MTLRAMLAAAAVSSTLLTGCVGINAVQPAAPAAAGPVKVVYHLTLGLEEAQRGIGNIRNHLAADPSARIVVVGNGDGILFMLDGAKDRNGNPFEVGIQELKGRGVDFRLCNNTLINSKIERGRVLPEVNLVTSGVAEAARLQAHEAFVYLRP